MISVVRVKPGVQFTVIAPGGFRILSAFDLTCNKISLGDFEITSACDGEHSGPEDPHHSGNAYDLRSHGFTSQQKLIVLNSVMAILKLDHFYGFLESPDTDNEHFHFQVKKGTTYP